MHTLPTAPAPACPLLLHLPSAARPALGEMLKWGWVQFVATFAAVWWVASRAERWVFRNRLLDTRTYLDVAVKGQKF
jgi:hypothetical protein